MEKLVMEKVVIIISGNVIIEFELIFEKGIIMKFIII